MTQQPAPVSVPAGLANRYEAESRHLLTSCMHVSAFRKTEAHPFPAPDYRSDRLDFASIRRNADSNDRSIPMAAIDNCLRKDLSLAPWPAA